ncbi:MAG TPA: hypothetical protein VGH99_12690 [Pseudonocardia sp.]|jgi:predicted anti-sigma-YlaC factor YlaD
MTDCGPCRECLSADLDGEAGTVPASVTEHLAGCDACSRWYARVTQVNRLVRTAPAEPGPGLSDDQLAGLLDLLPPPPAAPSRARRLGRPVARVALALVGLAQALLGGLPLLVPGVAAVDPHAAMMGAGMMHMSHEYSAWNLALGVSFLAGAAWTRHLAGVLPVLASFVAVLLVVSGVDLVDGEVDPARVVSHALVVLGLVLVVAIVALGAPRPTLGPVRADLDPLPDAPPRPAVGAETGTGGPAGRTHRHRPNPAARHRAA